MTSNMFQKISNHQLSINAREVITRRREMSEEVRHLWILDMTEMGMARRSRDYKDYDTFGMATAKKPISARRQKSTLTFPCLSIVSDVSSFIILHLSLS